MQQLMMQNATTQSFIQMQLAQSLCLHQPIHYSQVVAPRPIDEDPVFEAALAQLEMDFGRRPRR